jgi:hypothetical protein
MVAGWYSIQHSAITKANSEVDRSAGAIEDGEVTSQKPASPPKSTVQSNTQASIWKQIALQVGRDNTHPEAAIYELLPKLRELSEQEALAGLDQLPSLDLTDAARTHLELILGSVLAQKNPELALKRFSSHINDKNAQYAGILQSALRQLATTDTASACRWLDEQTAAGQFESKALDGKNPLRAGFEAVLIGALLTQDPTTASSRLGTMTENQRAEVLKQCFSNHVPTESESDAFISAVRKSLPPSAQANTLTVVTLSKLRDGGLWGVSNLLDRSQLSTAIRAETAEATLFMGSRLLLDEKITQTKVDDVCEWMHQEKVVKADYFVGLMLSQACQNNRNSFAESAALVLKFQRKVGNDAPLIAFLSSTVAKQNKEQSLALVDSISNQNRRAAIRKTLE